jgi:predicted TIM-barrel fold metal-dependent hydrolase
MTRQAAPTDDLFIPEPTARTVEYTVISVDDHVVEPPHTFEGRLPRRLQDRAPRVVTTDDGDEVWDFDGVRISQIGLNAFAGRRPEHKTREPLRFDQMRPGCYEVDARMKDMDINGVWASLSFPSSIAGFCGRVFSSASDRDLAVATTRAWNDWIYEEWYLAHPERIIANGLTHLTDPGRAAEEILRNAARGFRSVTLPERPHRIGLPSIYSDHWDPILCACAETGTVVALHVGSSGMLDPVEGAPQTEVDATMFSGMSLWACTEWLWSPYPRRYPDLRIVMAEGGIGWVAMLIDRLEKISIRYADGSWEVSPAEMLRRNFRFCTIDDYSAMSTRHVIGVENIMLEVDYPHIDGTWPDTQSAVARLVRDLPVDEVRAICCENAAALFRHPLPPEVRPRRTEVGTCR